MNTKGPSDETIIALVDDLRVGFESWKGTHHAEAPLAYIHGLVVGCLHGYVAGKRSPTPLVDGAAFWDQRFGRFLRRVLSELDTPERYQAIRPREWDRFLLEHTGGDQGAAVTLFFQLFDQWKVQGATKPVEPTGTSSLP